MERQPRGNAGPDNFLRSFMSSHRLKVVEVAEQAGVSRRSIGRLRSGQESDSRAPRTATLHRIADALESLTQVDSAEIFAELLRMIGRGEEIRQADLGLRGATELTRHYKNMNALGRHLLLEVARLLAKEMPDKVE